MHRTFRKPLALRCLHFQKRQERRVFACFRKRKMILVLNSLPKTTSVVKKVHLYHPLSLLQVSKVHENLTATTTSANSHHENQPRAITVVAHRTPTRLTTLVLGPWTLVSNIKPGTWNQEPDSTLRPPPNSRARQYHLYWQFGIPHLARPRPARLRLLAC